MNWWERLRRHQELRKKQREESRNLASAKRTIRMIEKQGGPANVRETMDFDMLKARVEAAERRD